VPEVWRKEVPAVSFQTTEGSADSAVRTTVLRVAGEVLRTGPLAPLDSFYDIGGSSLQAIRICIRLEKELGWEIDPTLLLDSDTLGLFADMVVRLGSAR
jgi:acyl carrier protein